MTVVVGAEELSEGIVSGVDIRNFVVAGDDNTVQKGTGAGWRAVGGWVVDERIDSCLVRPYGLPDSMECVGLDVEPQSRRIVGCLELPSGLPPSKDTAHQVASLGQDRDSYNIDHGMCCVDTDFIQQLKHSLVGSRM
jgi:hypothetical protein